MANGMNTIIYPTKDIAGAKQLYRTLLDSDTVIDQPYYVGFEVDGQDIGLDPNGHSKGMTGPVAYWDVDDIRTALERLLSAGAALRQDVTDVGVKLIATIADADGNLIGLLQRK